MTDHDGHTQDVGVPDEVPDNQPVQTDNRPTPEDGEQLDETLATGEGTAVEGDADDAYDPDRDGIEDPA